MSFQQIFWLYAFEKVFFLFFYGEIETVTWQSFFITYLITLYVHFTVCLTTVKILCLIWNVFVLSNLPLRVIQQLLRLLVHVLIECPLCWAARREWLFKSKILINCSFAPTSFERITFRLFPYSPLVMNGKDFHI